MKVCPRCLETYSDDTHRCPRDGAELRVVLDPFAGTTIGGRYRIIDRLGSGGMSSVYLARHVKIERLVAVKVLRRDLARDPVQRDRFLREARAVNRINHKNIVEITDYGETDDGLVYLVMEYVPGPSLLQALNDAPFAPHRALHIVEQCATALGRAHQMNVVHRDLKPENILLTPRKGGGDFVKILDFGIAKILDAPSLTGSQQIFGTPGYIAPEYIQSTNIDGRADLYSLGVILYEMVTGALPYDYEYPGDLLVKHVTEQPIRPKERLPEVSDAMERFILQSLAKAPEDRFRDAYHYLDELRRVRGTLDEMDSWSTIEEPRDDDSDGAERLHGVVRADGLDSGPKGAVVRRPLRRSTRPPPPAAPDRSQTPTWRPPGAEPADRVTADYSAAVVEPVARKLGTPAEGVRVSRKVAERISELPPNQGMAGEGRCRERLEETTRALTEVGRSCAIPRNIGAAALRAGDLLEDLERASTDAEAGQERLERLSERARGMRETLGRGMDDIAGTLSRQRGEYDTLASRRAQLASRAAALALEQGEGDVEVASMRHALGEMDADLRVKGARCVELGAQLTELQMRLELENEKLDSEKERGVEATAGQLRRLDVLTLALRQNVELIEAFVVAHRPTAHGAS